MESGCRRPKFGFRGFKRIGDAQRGLRLGAVLQAGAHCLALLPAAEHRALPRRFRARCQHVPSFVAGLTPPLMRRDVALAAIVSANLLLVALLRNHLYSERIQAARQARR